MSESLVAQGKLSEAARLYRETAQGSSIHATPAAQRIAGLVQAADGSTPLDDLLPMLQAALQLQQQMRWPIDATGLLERAGELTELRAQGDPRGALAILDAIGVLVPDERQRAGQRQALLERLVALEPEDFEMACQLALVYEAQGELERCEPLLAPHLDRLGASEAARLLGQLFAQQGKFEESHRLLVPYCQQELVKLRAAEQSLEMAETTFLAIRGVAGESDEYRLFLGQVYYWLGKQAANGEEPLREAVLSDADVQRALALRIERGRQLPEHRAVWEWALMRHAQPEEATRIAAALVQDETGQLVRSIEVQLAPASASTAYEAYWSHQLAGREAEGLEILRRCAELGTPLPSFLIEK